MKRFHDGSLRWRSYFNAAAAAGTVMVVILVISACSMLVVNDSERRSAKDQVIGLKTEAPQTQKGEEAQMDLLPLLRELESLQLRLAALEDLLLLAGKGDEDEDAVDDESDQQ